MAQVLTVCRVGSEWAVRDATGEHYGHSPVIDEAIEAAHRLSRRNGSAVVISAEAAFHIQTSAGLTGQDGSAAQSASTSGA